MDIIVQDQTRTGMIIIPILLISPYITAHIILEGTVVHLGIPLATMIQTGVMG